MDSVYPAPMVAQPNPHTWFPIAYTQTEATQLQQIEAVRCAIEADDAATALDVLCQLAAGIHAAAYVRFVAAECAADSDFDDVDPFSDDYVPTGEPPLSCPWPYVDPDDWEPDFEADRQADNYAAYLERESMEVA